MSEITDIGEWKDAARHVLSTWYVVNEAWDEVLSALLYRSEEEGMPLFDALVEEGHKQLKHMRKGRSDHEDR